ncbi:MAG TPA: PASTA domain-containing protein [Vicinamibacterales bacterium]|nr:PASTA domain-containing protein [Vicinamibacterales bacterium]
MTLKWLVAAAVTASVPMAFVVVPEPTCGDPAGRVDGIKVDEEKRDEVDRKQMSVERGGVGNPGRNGMPLCFGDVIVTGAQVTAILRLDAEPAADRTLTLSPNTTTELTDSSSIFLRIGRLFVSLHGRFDIKTVFARLGARGTEFDVTVTNDLVDVVQLEGILDVVPTAPTLTIGEQMAGGPWIADALGQSAPMQLQPLTRGAVGRRTPPSLPPVDETLVRKIVDTNANAILVTRPQTPSECVINVYDSNAARAAAYREARFRTVWSPEQKEHFQQLGDVYHDWAEAGKATRAYSKAGDVPALRPETPRQLNARGNVLRLSGDLDGAETVYRQAIAADPLFAFPYNGMGDVYRDRSLAALDKGQRLQGYELALKSRDFYQQSLDPQRWGKEGGPNRAVALYNLGEILRQLGDIQASEPAQTDFSPAKQFYADADKRFQEALAESGNQSPFAQVGRARVKISESRMYQIGRRTDLQKQALDQAQAQLEKTITTYPTFAVARQTLGDALDESGQRERAAAAYSQATQLDPQDATAYFKVASTLDRLGRTDQARAYYGTYARVESPVFRGGSRMVMADKVRLGGAVIASPSPSNPTASGGGNTPVTPAPPAFRVPMLSGLSRSDAEKALKNAGLALGRTTAQPSNQKRDTVIGQSIPAGDAVAKGTKVDLILAGPEKPMGRVPDLVGDMRKNALKEITSRHFTVGQVRQQASCEDIDKVIGQDPPKNAQVPDQTPIHLVVAAPGDIRVPDLRGRSQPEAQRILRDAGLVVSQTRTMETDQVKPGEVVRVDPKPGTMLAKGCGVMIVSAIAVPRVSVPNFVGMTLAQAKQQLPSGFAGALSDFKLGTVTERHVESSAARTQQVGIVIAQDPKAGTMVPKRGGTAVNLVISAKGKD